MRFKDTWGGYLFTYLFKTVYFRNMLIKHCLYITHLSLIDTLFLFLLPHSLKYYGLSTPVSTSTSNREN